MNLSFGVLCCLEANESDVGLAGDAAKFTSGLADTVVLELHNCGSSAVVARGRAAGSNRSSALGTPRSASCDGGVQLSSLSSAMQQSADQVVLT